jgi:hypothetical protein
MKRKIIKMKDSLCLNCGALLNRVASLEEDSDHNPSPGDISVCLNCGHILIFTEDLGVRELTEEEVIAVAGRKEIVKFNRIRENILKKIREE